jgi:2-polyprenyl-6-methoxyphenol hydroxylase-like FAD-dependent oxidoreductase
MNTCDFDLVTVGGGLGASALALSMARRGARVLVLEKEKQFRDRVRGESLVPWGAAEAKDLGIYELLLTTCAQETPWVEMGFGPRNLADTTLQKLPGISYCHPEMQEVLLAEAGKAGAQVRRGVTAKGIEANPNHSVVIAGNGKDERISARFVAAADGRASAARSWMGFAAGKNGHPFQFAGVLLTGVATREDAVTFLFNPSLGLVVGVVPQKGGRCRSYLGYPRTSGLVLHGSDALGAFLAECRKVSPIVQRWYDDVKSVGPLATFEGSESWVDHPYRNGVALLGDAAGTSDPSFGQGMSITLRDARVLRDALLGHSDWNTAGHEYARQHDIYFHQTHKVCGWMRTLFQDPSAKAQALRQQAMPKIAEDLSRVPDHLFSGPEMPADETVRDRFFGVC